MKSIKLILLGLCPVVLSAQNPESFCGTSFGSQSTLIQSRKIPVDQHKEFSQLPIYVPLQVHIVQDDNGSAGYSYLNLMESICTLNEDFEPSGLQFYLENPVNYINKTAWNTHLTYNPGEEMMIQSNVPNMVNCYIVSNPAGNCGYFTYRGDGVALSKGCLGKKSHTWAHELGHYFSLGHTFFGWEGIVYNSSKPTEEYQSQVRTEIENVVRDQCHNQADHFCDTYPDYISNRWSCDGNKKSTLVQIDKNGVSFTSDGTLFMSYASDACMNRFSIEQMADMNNFYSFNRSYLKRNQIEFKAISNIDYSSFKPLDSSTIYYKNPTFTWDPVPGADGYIFQLSRNDIFTAVLKTVYLKTPFYQTDSLVLGKNHYWRIKPLNAFNFCTPFSNYHTVVGSLLSSNQQAEINTNIKIYPSPVQSGQKLYVENKNTDRILSIAIQDLTGKTIMLFNPIHTQDHISIDLPQLKAGLYYLIMKSNTGNQSTKFIVTNP